MHSVFLAFLLLLLSCVPKEDEAYNFAVLSIDNAKSELKNPLLSSIESGLLAINNQGVYKGELLEYHDNWNTGLRLALNSQFYQLILPINILPNLLNQRQSNEILSLIQRYPEQQFALPFELYRRFSRLPENLTLNIIYVHETAFLAGVIAATLSKHQKIAIVIENYSPRSDIYSIPFIQGVRQIKENVFIKAVKVSHERFVATGKTLATSLYQDDFDVIFEISDHSLRGLLQAAIENQGYIITHQQYSQEDKGRIMVELIQRLDKSLARLLKNLNQQSEAQQIYYGNLASGDALISWEPHANAEFVSSLNREQQDLLPQLEKDLGQWKKRIINGRYQVHNVALAGQETIAKYAADETLDFN